MKIKVNDIELYYERYGNGEPVIFSHGWLDDCSVWKPQAEMLARDHTVILYDLRGHGRSDKPKGSYSVQTMANDLNSLIHELKLDKVTLVGFSMGGALSLVCTLRNPEKISRLVLIGSAAKMPRRAYLLLYPLIFFSYRFLIKWFYPRVRFHKPSQRLIDAFVAMAIQVPEDVAYDSLNELIGSYDIRNEVSRIKLPTLIVRGQKDPGMPKAVLDLNQHIAGSRLQVVADGGHEVMVDKPEEFNRILKEFLG